MKHETILIRGTLAEQVTAWCEHRRQDIGHLTADSPADVDTDELITMWDELDTFNDELKVWIRDLAAEIGRRFPKPVKEGERPTIEHPTVGTLEATQSSTVHWDGLAVLAALSQPVVDGDGVMLDAVPTEILERVLPAVAGVSSKWKSTELPKAVVNRHRSVTYGPTLPRRV